MSDFLKRIAEFSPKRLMLLAAELEERVRALEGRNHAPIAIVGMGCRFPGGVHDAESFWQLLQDGRDAITEVPKSRWDVDELYDPNPHAKGKVATRWGGFLEDPEMFDAGLFGIAPVEAVGMDPQQRLLLEVSWEALEDAAIAPSSLNGSKTGVFIGLCNSDYGQLSMGRPAEQIEAYFAQGASHAVASGRISYFLGLRGPSISIDTACSSSLVAIHEACLSLRTGESDLALSGGANLLFCPEVTMALSRAQMMAADGRCKAFSAAANGFVRSEGCGVVVLKRLDDAERDGDRVLAVIRGTALNQDGRSSGLTAPNGPSQVEVIRAALKDAGIAPEAVSYVEAHGTGTSLGDTIEMQALGEALGQSLRAAASEKRLPVGSVKANFGHAESAAGVAGLIKLALALDKKTIPASLHCAQPNPKIDWDLHRTRVPIAEEVWQPAEGQTLRIGSVSSFGFSGTNAHIVVTEAPALPEVSRDGQGTRVIALSARSESALKTIAAELSERLRKDDSLTVEDVAYTLAVGRSAFAYRAAVRADSKEQLIEELDFLVQGVDQEESRFSRGVTDTRAPRVAFLFAGQGGERTGMGLTLLKQSAVFRAAVAEVDVALAGVISTTIEAIFRNEHQELAQSALVQPALFAFQYGLARVWQSWGIEPHIVVGHSMGELVAATIAGVMSVDDAAKLIAARGRLTGELGDPGGMVAIAAPEERVQAALAPYKQDVSIAAINGSAGVVISGRAEAVELATQDFERAGVRVKRLNITYGSHSPAMNRVLPAFHVEAAKARYLAPRLPIIADLTGTRVDDGSVFNAQYWTAHLSRPVQFARCLEELEKEGCGLCIEMGPRAVLTAFGKERGDTGTRWVASASGREDDFDALQTALAEAFVAGAAPDWKAVFGEQPVRKVVLPTYPFERQRYWIGDEQPGQASTASRATQRSHGKPVSEDFSGLPTVRLDASIPIFESELQTPLPWHLDQHRVGGKVVIPASAYLTLAWSAARSLADTKGKPAQIIDIDIMRPLQPEDVSILIQTTLTKGEDTDGACISSRKAYETDWSLHAKGKIGGDVDSTPMQLPSFDKDSAKRMRGEEFYGHLDAEGVHLGVAFRAIRELWYAPGKALGRVVADASLHAMVNANVGPHPALLDACFQVVGAAAIAGDDTQLRLMTHIDDIRVYGELRGEMLVETTLDALENGVLRGAMRVRDQQGSLLVSADGIVLRPMAADIAAFQVHHLQDSSGWLYEPAWEAKPLAAAGAQPRVDRRWIVLGTQNGVAAKVAEELKRAGEQAEVASEPEDSQGELPIEFVDLRAIESEAFAASIINDAKSIARRAAIHTMENLDLWQQAIKGTGGLFLFTRGAQPARSRLALDGAIQATLWGLARCGTLEHSHQLRRIVDMDPAFDTDKIVETVTQELLARDEEEQVAYDGESRLAYRLKRSLLHEHKSAQIKHDKSYLLTGGLGGLGLRVAEWLGKQRPGKLVLITRSLSSVAARQSEIDALTAAGANIEVIQADVADFDSMQSLFARFGVDLPPLAGILHMAADVSGAPMEKIEVEQVRSMYRAKVQGTWVLHSLTRDLSLDFFVGFSSTAAVLGSSNLGHYAAANCFVDAMAALRKAEGLPFVSISWGTWQTMRLASKELQQQYSSGGMMPMSDDAALAWLGELLHDGVSHAMVANVDWQMLAPLYELKRPRAWLEYLRRQESSTESALSTATAAWSVEPGESRLSALERVVQKEAARVLGFRRGEMPGSSVRLADLGLDSLMAVTLRNRLQAMVGQGLPPTFAFEHPTPAEMAIALDMLLWGSGVAEDEHSAADRDEIQI